MMTSKVFFVITLSLLQLLKTTVSQYADEMYPGNQDYPPQIRLNYPAGLRRKPSNPFLPVDIDQDILDQLVDEQARRRFHKQIEQQLEAISRQINLNYKLNSRLRDRWDDLENNQNNQQNQKPVYANPEFEYNLPKAPTTGDVVFGIPPSDPRYNVEEINEDSYEDAPGEHADTTDNEQQVLFKYINPQKNLNNFKTNLFANKNSNNNIKPSINLPHHLNDNNHNFVVKESMGLDNDTNVYVVALIAGVTAAVTAGLIVLVVAWYTLHKKSKAASDMEYPAYGVTGPCKELLQSSGDKRLAQSAEIYHYQHQKQQIIAMEKNVPNDLNNAAISDVESEDDNEEGDYTVYECPGLAPTCEMEVKNPLFLDETPVTPSGGKNQNTE